MDESIDETKGSFDDLDKTVVYVKSLFSSMQGSLNNILEAANDINKNIATIQNIINSEEK